MNRNNSNNYNNNNNQPFSNLQNSTESYDPRENISNNNQSEFEGNDNCNYFT